MTEEGSTLQSRARDDLAREIRRLCQKTHGKEYVEGWEAALFRACTGNTMLPTVDYGEMARLLRLFMDAGGWMLRVDGVDRFVPRGEWAQFLRSEGK